MRNPFSSLDVILTCNVFSWKEKFGKIFRFLVGNSVIMTSSFVTLFSLLFIFAAHCNFAFVGMMV